MTREEIDEINKLETDFNDIDELNLALEVSSKKAIYLLDEFSTGIFNLQEENKHLQQQLDQALKDYEELQVRRNNLEFLLKSQGEELKELYSIVDKAIETIQDYINTIGEVDINEVLEILEGGIKMNKYIISEDKLKELLEDSWYLTDLQNAGVDNWEGIAYLDELDDEEEISTEDFIKENFEQFKGE